MKKTPTEPDYIVEGYSPWAPTVVVTLTVLVLLLIALWSWN